MNQPNNFLSFSSLSSPKEIGGYLYANIQSYNEGNLPQGLLLASLMKASAKLGCPDKAIALVEADPEFVRPKDWDAIKESLVAAASRIGDGKSARTPG